VILGRPVAHPSTLVGLAKRLREDLRPLRFGPPISHVYNPLTYAWTPHVEYLRRYGAGKHPVLIVGMNAGYFGMAQTGIPFGDMPMVRDWLGIHAPVSRPRRSHPRRPIEGFDCNRREVSGQRLWGWARDRYKTPECFFARFFVLNYCPLCFLEASGANRTPDKLPPDERTPLFAVCDNALRGAAIALNARYAIGLGRFAERRVERVLGDSLVCGGAPHPSPANARPGRDFAREMDVALAVLGIRLPT
jgi:single-strand selective monofunctional uracil DNA glycosylase